MATLPEINRKRKLTSEAESELRSRLAMAGYYCSAEPAVETDIYYSQPNVWVRIRERDNAAEIAYTATPGSTREIQVMLADITQAGEAAALLKAIGAVGQVRVVKTRAIFKHLALEDARVVIDQISGVGTFVAVEVALDDADARGVVANVERHLQLDELPMIELPYRELVTRAVTVAS
ncbi:CYTH domain-containing protein [Saccharopolyspora sp. NPDC050389]|uniref:CYTH domain-containing protein n=1 Tax=Saccharopolyspora sp. NPDC050389 TaxID=3155516 RepID=UPI0033C008E2